MTWHLGQARQAIVATCLVAALLTFAARVAPAADPSADSPDARASLYDDLSREVDELERHSKLLKKVVKLVGPTVVHISSERSEQASSRSGRGGVVEEAGSGVIIQFGEKHYVLTNRHVIRYAAVRDIKIRLADGRQIAPEKVWTDPDTDLAVMAVDAEGLLAARLGDSDKTEIGDFVLAIGSPFGLSHSVTFGIISAKGRRDLELGDALRFQDFLQTDTRINPGNSGGPLINLRGQVVGINTAIASNSGVHEGVGFAIPSNMALFVAKQLVEKGTVVRGYLGVALDGQFNAAAAASLGLVRPRGTRIKAITPGSPAETAKLQAGDVILEFGGVNVDNDSHLISLVSITDVDQEVVLTVLRDTKSISMVVKVAQAPSSRAAAKK